MYYNQYFWVFTMTFNFTLLLSSLCASVFYQKIYLFIYPRFYLFIYWGAVSEKSALFGQDNCGWEASVKLQVYIKTSEFIIWVHHVPHFLI